MPNEILRQWKIKNGQIVAIARIILEVFHLEEVPRKCMGKASTCEQTGKELGLPCLYADNVQNCVNRR